MKHEILLQLTLYHLKLSTGGHYPARGTISYAMGHVTVSAHVTRSTALSGGIITAAEVPLIPTLKELVQILQVEQLMLLAHTHSYTKSTHTSLVLPLLR